MPSNRANSIYKVSHGRDDFTTTERQSLLDRNTVTVHQDTSKGGGKNFCERMRIGDLICLNHSNDAIVLIGKITSAPRQNPDKDEGWMEREYEVLLKAEPPPKRYTGPQKGWSPNYRSTCFKVPRSELLQNPKRSLQQRHNIIVS